MLGICQKHCPAHDLTRNDLRDLVLGCIQASWIRSQAVDHTNGTSHVVREQKLLQNTCRILRSAVANRKTPHPPRPVGLPDVGAAVQSRSAPMYLPGSVPVRYNVSKTDSRALLSSRRAHPCASVHLPDCLFLVPSSSRPAWQCQCKRYLDGPPQYSSAKGGRLQMYCPHPAKMPILPSKPRPSTTYSSLYCSNASCLCMFSRKLNLSAGSLVTSGKRRREDASFEVGAED